MAETLYAPSSLSIFMDCHMPVMNEFDAHRKRQLGGSLRQVIE